MLRNLDIAVFLITVLLKCILPLEEAFHTVMLKRLFGISDVYQICYKS